MVSVIHCWSDPPRPLESKVLGSSKICNPPMVEVSTMKIRVGRIIGMVTKKKRLTRLAPSMMAAS